VTGFNTDPRLRRAGIAGTGARIEILIALLIPVAIYAVIRAFNRLSRLADPRRVTGFITVAE
jgi:hypothetical protein